MRNLPPPVQRRLPLLVGGGGEKVTLKLVAQYADANNVGGGFENVKRKDAILRQHCEAIGRDEREIERTAGIGSVIIRDSRAEAKRVQKAIFEHNGKADLWADQPVGTPEDVVEMLAPYASIGYRHLIAGFPSPYDEESMTRLMHRGEAEARAMAETGRGSWRDGRGLVGTGPARPVLGRRRAARSGIAPSIGDDVGGRRSRSAGWSTAGSPVTAWAVDRMEVFAVFPDGELWDRYWDGDAWHPWESLGGELARDAGRLVVGSGSPGRLRPGSRRPDLAPLVGRRAVGAVGDARRRAQISRS